MNKLAEEGKIVISVQVRSGDIADMAKQAGLVSGDAHAGEAASLLQPVMRGTLYDWMPALIEEACNRMLVARKEQEHGST